MTRKRKHYTPGADPKPALAEALENLKKRKGPATEADSTPFRRILEIKPVPVLPGQLDIYGNEKGRAMTVRREPCSTEKVNTAALRAANTIHDLAGDFAYRESYRPLEELAHRVQAAIVKAGRAALKADAERRIDEDGKP